MSRNAPAGTDMHSAFQGDFFKLVHYEQIGARTMADASDPRVRKLLQGRGFGLPHDIERHGRFFGEALDHRKRRKPGHEQAVGACSGVGLSAREGFGEGFVAAAGRL